MIVDCICLWLGQLEICGATTLKKQAQQLVIAERITWPVCCKVMINVVRSMLQKYFHCLPAKKILAFL